MSKAHTVKAAEDSGELGVEEGVEVGVFLVRADYVWGGGIGVGKGWGGGGLGGRYRVGWRRGKLRHQIR